MRKNVIKSVERIDGAGKFAERSSALHVIKSLLRLIGERDLAVGDQVPSQRELRKLFGVSNHSISAAMGVLADAGILERRVEAGTFLRKPDLLVPRVWSCALAFWPFSEGDTVFYSYLFHAIQRGLMAKGVRPRLYSYTGVPSPGMMRIKDFPGLEEDVEDGLVDTLVCPGSFSLTDIKRLQDLNAPYVNSGSWDAAPAGVVIDQHAMALKAATLLASKGCRRLATVSAGAPNPSQCRFWDGFTQGAAASGIPASSMTRFDSGNKISKEAGGKIGERILATPGEERPDGVLIVNDWLAMGVCEALRETDKPPIVAAQVNKQTPVHLPPEVLRFEVDINKMASLTVDLALRTMIDPRRAHGVIWLEPELAESR